MRSFVLMTAVAGALAAMSLSASAQDSSSGKSDAVKGPPNANGAKTSEHATTSKMKGSPNASGYDAKSKDAAPK